jgi:hypothetical protein
MPPQQPDRPLDFLDEALGFRSHDGLSAEHLARAPRKIGIESARI